MLFKSTEKISTKHIIFSLGLLSVLLFAAYYMKKNKCGGTVIILNGTSAVGKSSIMRAFQAKHDDVWLGMGIDNLFVGVLPAKFYLEDKPEHHVVMRGVTTEDAHGKLFTLYIGQEGQKVIEGMHHAIAAYAKAGNNVIVDYIMYDPAWLSDLQSALSGLPVIYVGVTASLPTLEYREKVRGTSPTGHARSVYETVHQGWNYNIMINTDDLSPEQCVERIDEYLEKQKH